MASLSLQHIKKVYGKDVVAVHDFNLDIADKEFIVFVGPSGCGKSTTLRMIAGLEEITEGELYIGDTLVNNVSAKDRDIAMVFQNYALYPHMTVAENMGFALKLKKLPKAEIKKRVEEAARILDITDYLSRKPKALSGGQRQRVAIGRAIVRNPKVFLMDEPLSNLDAKLRNQMRAEIIKLHQEINTTFIYVTHDQVEAMTLGERIVVMKDGHIQQIGTPDEVFNSPKNIFVAGFIGTPQMNFFENARLERDGDAYAICLCGQRLDLPEEKCECLRERDVQGQEITLGIRPENLILLEGKAEGSITARVEVSEQLGSETYVHTKIEEIAVSIKITDSETCKRFYIESRKNAKKGMEIELGVMTSNVHLFSKEGDNLIV